MSTFRDSNSGSTAIDSIRQKYESSPTAQALVNNAPQILGFFKEVKRYQMDCQMRLAALAQQQKTDLEKYRDAAPRILNEMSDTLKSIRDLQAVVREHAPLALESEGAMTVINYTNQQIDQNIAIFNSLTCTLLSL